MLIIPVMYVHQYGPFVLVLVSILEKTMHLTQSFHKVTVAVVIEFGVLWGLQHLYTFFLTLLRELSHNNGLVILRAGHPQKVPQKSVCVRF